MEELRPAYVTFGMNRIDARPYVTKAIKSGRVIRPDKAEAFLTEFVALFEEEGTGYQLRKKGAAMTDEDRRRYGLGYQISYETFAMLSDQMRLQPASKLDDLVAKIAVQICKEGHRRDAKRLARK